MKIQTSTLLALGAVLLLLQYSVRTFIADALFTSVRFVLDDPATEMRDMLDISDDTLPAYRMAIDRIRQAALWDPGNAAYAKTQADLYGRLGTWAQVIGFAGGGQSERMEVWNEDLRIAKGLLVHAVNLDPSNPDYRLALFTNELTNLQADENNVIQNKQLTMQPDVKKTGGKQTRYQTDDLEKTVQLYPMNAPIRYEVALNYMMIGENSKALEHAKILAMIGDRYFLYMSCELLWRASGRNVSLLKSSIPDNPEAREISRIFFEMKGIEE